MKISDWDSVNIHLSQSGKPEEPTKAGTSSAGARKNGLSKEDRIDMDAQSQLQALALAVSDPERADRVAQLRALYESGQYQVDATALSGAIVTAMLQGY
jgi:anti-sigma28 factor (negative regulator of flagellin synthesis)